MENPRRRVNPPVLFAIWVALLAALLVSIKLLERLPSTDDTDTKTNYPRIDFAKVEKNWPDVLKHAAAPPRGPANAAYTIVEFGDFQCPNCATARPLLEDAIKNAPVNMYFVQRPLENEHAFALAAAQLAAIAADKGKFWPMYDLLYGNQANLEPGFYDKYASSLGLNGAEVMKEVDDQTKAAEVRASSKYCTGLNIYSTPTILLRDNKTGIVTEAIGTTEIKPILKSPPWQKASAIVQSAAKE
ncbi:MAG: DsbA family protein [Capsulimonadaceae bacterium]